MFKHILLSLSQLLWGEKLMENKQKNQSTQTKQDAKQDTPKDNADFSALQQQIASKDAIIQEYTNQLKRLQAEFENYMKRAEKERTQVIQFANEKLILKLLSVLDNFEHTLDNLKKMSADKEITSGIEIVAKEFNKILETEGLKQITAKECKFDPYMHEVITCINKTDCPENTIVEEVQKGYTLSGRTIRYSKVIISKVLQQKTVQPEQEKTQTQQTQNGGK